MWRGIAIVALGLSALIAGTGCGRRPEPPPPLHPGQPATSDGPHDIHATTASAVFGTANVTELAIECAGRVRLEQGAATVNDACFTGDTNVVLCTDASSANPIQCTASNAKLVLTGSGSDLINYARVR
jgi:hypothetical protein